MAEDKREKNLSDVQVNVMLPILHACTRSMLLWSLNQPSNCRMQEKAGVGKPKGVPASMPALSLKATCKLVLAISMGIEKEG